MIEADPETLKIEIQDILEMHHLATEVVDIFRGVGNLPELLFPFVSREV